MTKRDQLKLLTEPTVVRRAAVPYLVWGDDESGYVNDLFYVLSSQLLAVAVTMPPGGRWRSSDRHRAFFDSHECIYVVKGQYTCQDPETGEVRTVQTGEMLFMPEKRWHYGSNFGSEDLHTLEIIAPPTNPSLAHVPRPRAPVGWDGVALKNWPRKPDRSADQFRVCRLDDSVDALIGHANPILCRILACTERVFLGLATVPARCRSDEMVYPFDVCYLGEKASMTMQAEAFQAYFAIHEGDVAFMPAGIPHRLFNHTGAMQRIVIGGAGSFTRLTVA